MNVIFLSLLRQALLAGGGYLVGKGISDAGTVTAVVGAVMAGISSAWATYNNTPTQVVAKAASLPEVDRIRVKDEAIAEATGPKVTGPYGL